MPRPGGYWFTPPRTAATASSNRLCGPSVSGKPWPRLIAPVLVASALIVAKTVGATAPAASRRLAERATWRQRPRSRARTPPSAAPCDREGDLVVGTSIPAVWRAGLGNRHPGRGPIRLPAVRARTLVGAAGTSGRLRVPADRRLAAGRAARSGS